MPPSCAKGAASRRDTHPQTPHGERGGGVKKKSSALAKQTNKQRTNSSWRKSILRFSFFYPAMQLARCKNSRLKRVISKARTCTHKHNESKIVKPFVPPLPLLSANPCASTRFILRPCLSSHPTCHSHKLICACPRDVHRCNQPGASRGHR